MTEQAEANSTTAAPTARGEDTRAATEDTSPGTAKPTEQGAETVPETGPSTEGDPGAEREAQPKTDPRIHPSLIRSAPAEEPEKTPERKETTAEAEGPEKAKPPAEEAPEEEQEKRPRSRYERRIAQLQKARTVSDQALAEKDAEIARLKANGDREPEPGAREDDSPLPPKASEFMDVDGYLREEDYLSAVRAHEGKRAREEAQAAARAETERAEEDRQRQARQAESQKERQEWDKAESAYRAKNATYDDDFDRIVPLLFSQVEVQLTDAEGRPTGQTTTVPKNRNRVLVEALAAERSPELLHWLSARPDLLEGTPEMGPDETHVLVGRILGQFEAGSRPSPKLAQRGPTPTPLPTIPKGGSHVSETHLTEENVRSKGFQWAKDNLDKIDASIAAGKFYVND